MHVTMHCSDCLCYLNQYTQVHTVVKKSVSVTIAWKMFTGVAQDLVFNHISYIKYTRKCLDRAV